MENKLQLSSLKNIENGTTSLSQVYVTKYNGVHNIKSTKKCIH